MLVCLGFVYRFISTGTIEEKIFQRQANKQALSSAVVDEKEDAERHFSIDALRQLFLFNEKTLCETHETFKCKRCKNGKQMVKAPALLYGDASTYVSFLSLRFESNRGADGITLQMRNSRTITTICCVRNMVFRRFLSRSNTSVIRPFTDRFPFDMLCYWLTLWKTTTDGGILQIQRKCYIT